jgi:hypothetical protein
MMVIRTSLSTSRKKELQREGANGSHENVPGFGPDGQIESLSYPGEICDRLKVLLRESTSLYPVARRTMSVFEVGFLERV